MLYAKLFSNLTHEPGSSGHGGDRQMKSHIIHIQKWANPAPPTEPMLTHQLESEGLAPYKWSSNPQDVFPAHDHPYDKVIMVLAGSITFGFPIVFSVMILGSAANL